ncbi:MAG: hypothetical protein H7Z75_02590 [Ferruginibacter sp.]|nr:hypothetical protein [Cytophagales bacterium]
MLPGLTAGFIAAFPVNYALVKRGARHQHERATRLRARVIHQSS